MNDFLDKHFAHIAIILLLLVILNQMFRRRGCRCSTNSTSTPSSSTPSSSTPSSSTPSSSTPSSESFQTVAMKHMFGNKENLSYVSQQKEHFGGPEFTYANPPTTFSASSQHSQPFIGSDFL